MSRSCCPVIIVGCDLAQMRRSSGIGIAVSPSVKLFLKMTWYRVLTRAGWYSRWFRDPAGYRRQWESSPTRALRQSQRQWQDNYSAGARPQEQFTLSQWTAKYFNHTQGRSVHGSPADNTKVWLNMRPRCDIPLLSIREKRDGSSYRGGLFRGGRDAGAFRVKVNGLVVSVLGTTYIMAYADEERKNTLLEGKISSVAGVRRIYWNREQAAVSAAGKWEILKDIKCGKYIAWKNGFHSFRSCTPPEVCGSSHAGMM